MSVTVKQWIQREWTRAGVSLWQRDGDFYQLSLLEPSATCLQLQRVPVWHGRVRTNTHGLTNIRGAFYDPANSRTVLLGSDAASGDLAAGYLDASWNLSTLTVLHTTPANLGGLSLRDFAYYGGYLILIGSDQQVYYGPSYTAALSSLDTGGNHRIICPIDERFYVVKDSGAVDRTNDAGTALESYFTPDFAMDVRFMAPYRGYALLATKDSAGNLHIQRLPLNQAEPRLSHLGVVHDPGSEPGCGCLYCMHEDTLYFSPGFFTVHGQQNALNLYRFNGARVERIGQLAHIPNTGATGYPAAAGLLSLQGQLIYYSLAGPTTQIFKCLLGDGFYDHAQLTARVSGLTSPLAAAAGNRLLCTAWDGVDEGIHYLEDYVLGDGYVITSRLDMGYPDRKKRLLRLTVLLDGAAANFNVVIQYRTDEAGAWTPATTAANSRRVSVDITSVVEFHTLQLRIDIDDNTAANPDYRIDAVAVTYSVEN